MEETLSTKVNNIINNSHTIDDVNFNLEIAKLLIQQTYSSLSTPEQKQFFKQFFFKNNDVNVLNGFGLFFALLYFIFPLYGIFKIHQVYSMNELYKTKLPGLVFIYAIVAASLYGIIITSYRLQAYSQIEEFVNNL